MGKPRRYGPLSRPEDDKVKHACRKCGVATEMDSLCPEHRAVFKRIGMADGADAAEAWADDRCIEVRCNLYPLCNCPPPVAVASRGRVLAEIAVADERAAIADWLEYCGVGQSREDNERIADAVRTGSYRKRVLAEGTATKGGGT